MWMWDICWRMTKTVCKWYVGALKWCARVLLILPVKALGVMPRAWQWWRQRDRLKVRQLSRRQMADYKHFCRECGWTEQTEAGSTIYPAAELQGSDLILYILDSMSPDDVAKQLRPLGRIFAAQYTQVVEHDAKAGAYRVVASKLPDFVAYDDRPSDNPDKIWLGTDTLGEPVWMDYGHSPLALVTGASGSGKSVLGRVIITEAQRMGWDTYIVDGKGGIDWLGTVPEGHLITDFDVAADHYERWLEVMHERLQTLREIGAKNWMEARDKGHDMTPVLLLMDEASDFLVVGSKSSDKLYALKWRIIHAMGELARKSRAVGIYQLVSLQAAQSDAVPTDIKNNAGHRVSYALPTAAQSQVLFGSSIAFDPTLRGGKGVYAGPSGDPVVFRGAFLD